MNRPISSPSTHRGPRPRPSPPDFTRTVPTAEDAFVRATVAAVAAEIRKYAATLSALCEDASLVKRAEIEKALRDAFENLD